MASGAWSVLTTTYIICHPSLRDQRIGCGPAATTAATALTSSAANLFSPLSSLKTTTTPIIPHATTNRRDWEQWRVNRYDADHVTLFSVAHGVYLGVNSARDIKTTSRSVGSEELWCVKRYPVGGISLVPNVFRTDGLMLACNVAGGLYLCDTWCEGGACWSLEPRLPVDSMDSRDVTKSILGGAAVAMTFASGSLLLGLASAGSFVARSGLQRQMRRSKSQLLDGFSAATPQAIGVQNDVGSETIDLETDFTARSLARSGVIVRRNNRDGVCDNPAHSMDRVLQSRSEVENSRPIPIADVIGIFNDDTAQDELTSLSAEVAALIADSDDEESSSHSLDYPFSQAYPVSADHLDDEDSDHLSDAETVVETTLAPPTRLSFLASGTWSMVR